ncbi:MAG: hypothetical protein JGK27_00535 [Microcoleus sp. PH2017_20_SFW_D_A]|nr:hypothetical protein [Microcoleus sp. PH2017_36_ELK_O_B]MCC3520236.1 hypothetical protein [Microcoleus sp. PH2017_20_SFW_D_A]MCC3621472.1 hypothetical protein [Microcoleus sp. PH2017_36_ELK_O_B]
MLKSRRVWLQGDRQTLSRVAFRALRTEVLAANLTIFKLTSQTFVV